MAYAYRRRTAYRKKASRSTRRSYKRSTPRRSYGRGRPSTKRRVMMSRKKILNVTSEKKRDKMLTWTNSTTANQSGGTTYAAAPAVISGGLSSYAVACFAWCATGRDNQTAIAGRAGTKFDESTRTATSCYMVGLKEVIEIQVADGLPWQWRRICFTTKDLLTIGGFLPASGTGFAPIIETSVGYTRVLNQLTPAQWTTFFQLLFAGDQGTDWQDPMCAKLDKDRITVKYDKTCTVASGNEDGVIRKYNKWHPMRSTLIYDDDELAGTTRPATYSSQSRRSMGDYWVIDIIKPRQGSMASNQMSFNAESTLYWHER